jgi:hypothetical protein
MKTPLHLWIFGGLSFFWNLVGVADFTLTQTRNRVYMAQFTPEQAAYFETFPTWVNLSWAIAVWAAFLGAILLLLRKRLAPICFAISLIATAATAFQNFVLAKPTMTQIAGQGALWFSLLILVITCAQWLYARAMRQARYLR